MSWLAATLIVEAKDVESLSDALLEAGAISIDVTDAYAGTPEEHALFAEPGEPAAGEWTRARLTALFPADEPAAVRVAEALRAGGLDPATQIEWQDIAEQDWVRATQTQFQPLRVAQRLWVVPTWHTAPDPHAINLVIDPGLAFGTGTHPTTRLCLGWLDANLRGGESVLDYGCGSGILGIAALKLGAAHATGVDIDAQALLAARHNAMQNQVTMDFLAAETGAPPAADIVLANILANPLKMLAPLLARLTRPHGRLLLSGILDHQAAEVAAAYRAAFTIETAGAEDGWVLLSGVKQ